MAITRYNTEGYENLVATRIHGVVLLATYNEAGSIGPVMAEINEACVVLARSDIFLSVVIVDDASPDGTVDLAKEAAARFGLRITVLPGCGKGLGAAVLHGLLEAVTMDASFVVNLDADGQHDARQIPDLVRAHQARASAITIGSRWTRGGSSPGTSPARTVLSLAGNVLVRRVGGVRGVRDSTTSFRVIDPAVVTAVSAYPIPTTGYAFFSALIAIAQALGFTVDEVPITFRPRYSGISKLTPAHGMQFLRDLVQVRAVARRARSDRAQGFSPPAER